VQLKLAARARLLAAEAVNKNDPSDARPVVVTVLRSRMQREAAAAAGVAASGMPTPSTQRACGGWLLLRRTPDPPETSATLAQGNRAPGPR
jgi:hypothetical protein